MLKASLLLMSLLCASGSVLANSIYPERYDDYGHIEALLADFYGDYLPKVVDVRRSGRNLSGFNTGKMQITISNQRTGSKFVSTLAHETSHLALYNMTKGQSIETKFRFLDEGMANIIGARAADDPEKAKLEIIKSAKNSYRRKRLDFNKASRWNQFFGNPRLDYQNLDWSAYNVGASFGYYIIDTYGEAKLRELFVSIGETGNLDESVESVFNASSEAIQNSWNQYVKVY